MLEIGQPVPDFRLAGVAPDGSSIEFRRIEQRRWLALLFYPRDFSFVCPTELIAFSSRADEFDGWNCDLLGISIDPPERHHEWLAAPQQDGGVAGLQFPLASDPEGLLARELGIWDREKHLPHRAVLLLDPSGRLQYLVVHHPHVGRNVTEILRVLAALQTEGLCPASWTQEDGTLNPEEMLEPGRVLGHYRIGESLGSGTFGSVFAAQDLRLERPVALKVLRHASSQARQALLDEARAVASLSHPYLCTIYAVEELDHLPLIVMQYVEGGSLASWLSENRRLDGPTAKRVTRQLAEGLAAAHAHGVVHGDLKPANVLMDLYRSPVIVDFGMAAVYHDSSRYPAPDSNISGTGAQRLDATAAWLDAPSQDLPSSPLERTLDWNVPGRPMLGTPAYMSPEQARGAAAGPLSDVFSLGLIFAEMLSGQRVLHEDNLRALIHALRTEDLALRVQRLMGDGFPNSCLAMLRPDPADRPTARQVVAALN